MRSVAPLLAAVLVACVPDTMESTSHGELASTGDDRPPRSEEAPAPVEPEPEPEPAPAPEPVLMRTVPLQPLADPAVSSSPLALARMDDRSVALLADEDSQSLTLIDLEERRPLASLQLPGRPAHVVIDSMGRSFVAVRELDVVVVAQVQCPAESADCELELIESSRIQTPPEPIALALRGDSTLVVSCGRGRALLAHPLSPEGLDFVLPLGPEPRGIVVDPDGDRAVVAHALGSRISEVSLVAQSVTVERAVHWRDDITVSGSSVANIPRFAVQGHAVAMAQDRAHVPMVLAYPGEAAADSSGYGASVFGLDPYFPHEPVLISMGRDGTNASMRLRHEVLPVDRSRRRERRRRYPEGRPPCLLPRSVALTQRPPRLLVACADIGQVIEYSVGTKTLAEAESRRWAIGAGLNVVAIDPEHARAWAWAPFDRKLVSIDLSSDGGLEPDGEIAVPVTITGIAEQGRRLFHQPLMSDGRSCASCHVDGRDDGLVWRSPSGMVATPVLAGRLAGGKPFGWHGEQSDLRGHMRRTFRRLRAGEPDAETLDALSEYLLTIPTFASAPVQLSPQQLRGRVLFNDPETGCAACHYDDGLGVDGASHRVGTGAAVDTPSLRSLGSTAPYMHDGRYATLRGLLLASDGKMGSTAHLDQAELADLIAYLTVL